MIVQWHLEGEEVRIKDWNLGDGWRGGGLYNKTKNYSHKKNKLLEANEMVFHYTNFVVETNSWWLRRVRPVRDNSGLCENKH